MFITGPDVVKTVTGEDVSFEELGGAATHATRSGVAHFTAPDEETCLEEARYLLSYLPQNNVDYAAVRDADDPGRPGGCLARHDRPDSPNKPYDMKQVVERIVDDGQFLEVQAALGPEHHRAVSRVSAGCGRRGRRTSRVAGGHASTSMPP